MQRSINLTRMTDLARVLGRFLALRRHDRWSPERLQAHQRRRLLDTVARAVSHSRFYRELYGDIRIDEALDLRSLPVIGKREVVDRFDDMVTDRRLRLAEVKRHVAAASPDRDALYLGEYRVLATSGTSGLRGLFVFNRAEWRAELANTLRWLDFIGARPTLLRRAGVSVVGAPSVVHVSRRLPISGDLGLFRLQNLDVTSSLDRIVGDLQRFRPDILLAYPTMARLLALEQRAGRLGIAPRVVSTHSELLTGDTRRLIRSAWGVEPFDHYGLTEATTVAVECDRHRGLHLLSDDLIVEIVDDRHRAVEPGQAGSRLLLTSLTRSVQPLIRYEVSDRLLLAADPCPCGRPFPLVAAIEGRGEECLLLPAAEGRVMVPPLALSAILEEVPGIGEFAAHWDGARLRVSIVLTDAAEPASVETSVCSRLHSALSGMGVAVPEIVVSFVDRLPRPTQRMGKLRLVDMVR